MQMSIYGTKQNPYQLTAEAPEKFGMIQAKMSLEIVPFKTWSHISLLPRPTESEKVEAKLKAWQLVNKYRRRNLACKILDTP